MPRTRFVWQLFAGWCALVAVVLSACFWISSVQIARLADEAQRRRLAAGWLDPREIASGDPDKLPALPAGTTPQDAAAWTLVSRVLLNLDETVTKN